MRNSLYLSVLFFFFFLGNIFLFPFEAIPNFRDFVGVEYFYNIALLPQLGTGIKYLFNFIFDKGFDMVFAYQILFASYISFGFFFIYLGLNKFSQLLDLSENCYQKIFIFLLSFFCVYNPWVFERILMGQLTIFLGYSLLFLNLSFLFAIFKEWKYENIKGEVFSFNILFLGVSLLLSLLISPHYPILILALLGIYGLHILANSLFYTMNIKKILFQSCVIVLPSFLFLLFRYIGESQYIHFSQSLYQNQILENFSLWEGSQYFFLTSLIGGNSWMSNGFIEKINISLDLGFLNIFALGFYPLLSVLFFLFIGVIYAVVLWFYIKEYSIYKNTIVVFSLIAFPLFLILNFGLSGGMEMINLYFYEIPFSYVFRESGKFYALVLFSFSILLLLFWKILENEKKIFQWISHEILFVFILILCVSGFIPFLYLGKNLNQPLYPHLFSELQDECTPQKKILYIPLSQYSFPSYSPQIFMINPDRYLFSCSQVNHSITYLGNDKLSLNKDSQYAKLEDLIEDLSQNFLGDTKRMDLYFKNFLLYLKKEKVTYLVIDTNDIRFNSLTLKENVAKYIEMYKNEGTIFIFKL